MSQDECLCNNSQQSNLKSEVATGRVSWLTVEKASYSLVLGSIIIYLESILLKGLFISGVECRVIGYEMGWCEKRGSE